MVTFTTEKLLTFTPAQALAISINNALSLNLHPDYVDFTVKQALDAKRALVEVAASQSEPNTLDPKVKNKGQVVLRRIDLVEFFGMNYRIDYDKAIHTRDVARIITDRTGILFDDRDFVDAVLTPGANVLTAHAQSLRWVGSLTIVSA